MRAPSTWIRRRCAGWSSSQRCWRRIPPWLLLTGCFGDIIDAEPGDPVCDGVLQEGEEVVDGPWDLDRDGHYSDQNSDCRENYGENRLDCDDNDPTVNASVREIECNDVDDDCNPDTPDQIDRDLDGAPSCDDCDDDNPFRSPTFLEECGDQVDNDCSGVIDQDCPDDYNGIYALDQIVRYNCFLQLISLDFNQMGAVHDPDQGELAMYSVGGTTPGTLDGTVTEDGVFQLISKLDTEGCKQDYTLEGQFTSEARFEGTLKVEFTGFDCLFCSDRTWEIVGTRSLF